MDTLLIGAPVEIERFKGVLEGKTFGDTLVVSVALEVGEDGEAERALFVNLTLRDPKGETWPYEDIQTMRRLVIEEARRHPPIEMSIYVRLSPESDAPQEDDDPTQLHLS